MDLSNNIFQVDINPFSDEYLEQEVAFYNLEKPYARDGVDVSLIDIPFARCDDYLNKNMRINVPTFPILRIDGKTWMSLTYMELQSGFLPIVFAQGDVACGGLGLGYFVLRAMCRDEVDKIDVYEKEARIIAFFKETFGHRKGFEKLNFIEGDIHETMKGKIYDFVYVDIYPTLLGDEVITDLQVLCEQNHISDYHFWGIEKALFDAVNLEAMEPHQMPFAFRDYFRLWIAANDNHEMYEYSIEYEFAERLVEALTDAGILD